MELSAWIARVETASGRRWIVFDSDTIVWGKKRETQNEIRRRWCKLYGQHPGVWRWRAISGCVRESDLCQIVAEIRKEEQYERDANRFADDDAMTVAELIEALQDCEATDEVRFVCGYGDYPDTQQALPVVSVRELDPLEVIVDSAYSRSGEALVSVFDEEHTDDELDRCAVVLLRMDHE